MKLVTVLDITALKLRLVGLYVTQQHTVGQLGDDLASQSLEWCKIPSHLRQSLG